MNARSLPSDAPADPASPSLRLAPPEIPAGPRDPIAAWLDVLARLLRLPEAERAGIREELDTHLRDRTRDLMVTGLAEAEASARAISELGDTAVLAQRFNRAGRPPIRRKLMNLGMLAVTGAALVTGTLALSGPRDDRIAVAVFDPAITREAEQAADGRFDLPPNASWGQLFDAAGRAANLPVLVNWNALASIDGEQSINQNARTPISGAQLTLPEAVTLINEHYALPGNGLDYRAADGKLTFSTIDYFDRRETVLATYDLTGIVEARLHDADPTARQLITQQVAEEVAHLITELVHPEQWQDNGGDRAKLAIFGTKLFITAPKRFHPKIRWVLSELPTTAENQEPARAARSHAAAERDLKSLELKTRILDLQGQVAAIDSKRIELGQGEITPGIRQQQDALAEQRLKLALELDKLEAQYSAIWAASAGNQRELTSLERRAKAAQLKLEAIRTEYAQLEPLRAAGQMSATDAARRQAELMEEEAEVLDQIAEIENRRAELTGKPAADSATSPPEATPTAGSTADPVAAGPIPSLK